ncbi:MAG: cell division/cell wall cluster transcriptional repressor MraZ [bacterium]|nr:MAG: cell division/cell wall cluster transcriptional repressor MraZ [bacterium]
MLIGNYSAVLSDARRVAVPKKFTTELGEKPILAMWYEDCLILVQNSFWTTLSNSLVGGRNKDFGVRNIERFILGSAFETDPDEQGRIIIPESLAGYANLQKDLVFLGLVDRVEIWSKDVWDKKQIDLQKITREYIDNLMKNEK